MNTKKLLILGAGGHGKVAAETAEAMEVWDRICFLDDRYPELKNNLHWPVIGKLESIREHIHQFNEVFVAIGQNDIRLKWLRKCKEVGYKVANLIHPSAIVSPYADLEDGIIIVANAVVQTNAKLGEGVIINTSAHVDHDCRLGRGVHIASGAKLAGGVQVGDCSWIGIGATVIQNIVIGNRVTVGAGAVIIRDIPDDYTVVGVPGKRILSSKESE